MFDRINSWTAALVARIQREEGQAMVEYSLILALVSIAAILTLGFVGDGVDAVLQDVQDALGFVPTP
jgi:Flp pilus assembly pilin Flp